MAIVKILDGVYQISSGYVNSFIVDGDEGVCLVDTLVPKKEGVIEAGLKEIGRSLTDVAAILLTHSHSDHSGSAAAVKSVSNADVYASAADAPAIRREVKPPAPPTPWYVSLPFLLMPLLPAQPATEVDHLVAETGGAALPGDLRAVDTPGHTPGHTSFLLDRAGGVLFVGDAAKAAKDGSVVRGYFNRSTPLIDRSLVHIAEMEFAIAAFGHSDPISSQASAAFRRFTATFA